MSTPQTRRSPRSDARYLQWTLASGSARVLNCGEITAEIRRAGRDGPMLFRTPVLNNCVLIKDSVVPGLRADRELARRPVGTKIYLPFDGGNIFAGGQTFFFGTRQFDGAIADLVDMNVLERRRAFLDDHDRLRIIDELPSLAPFLLRDRLEREGIELDEAYYRLSADEWLEISLFIRAQLQRILDAAFADQRASSGDLLDRLLDKLWNLSDLAALDELAQAFRLPRDDPRGLFYAWKGIIFFSYEHARHAGQVDPLRTWLTRAEMVAATLPKDVRVPLLAMITDLRAQIETVTGEIASRLGAYEAAFQEMFGEARNPAHFVRFLSSAPEHFYAVGIATARLQHVIDVWNRMTARFDERRLPPDMLFDLLGILLDLSSAEPQQ